MTKMFASRFAQLCFLSASPLALVVAATPATAQAQTRAFDIPAQQLSSAVLEFSRQADVMVVLPPELAAGKRSAAVKGSLSVNAAIAQLLRRTGLRAMPNAAGGYRVAPFAEGRGAARAESSTASSGSEVEEPSEIIVTAQKREERSRDVPVPVTVLKANALAETNLTRMEDYFSRVPSLTVGPGIQGSNLLTLRGLVTGGGNPTVGVLVDDIPFGASTGNAGGFVVPDLDPGDLERVEVLRGPQGTLYGASSMGGLIKFVTVEPSTAAFTGRIQAGLNTVRYSDEVGYALRGSVNVPLSNTFAIRASAFTRSDPGYVDDDALGKKDVNTGFGKGGRLAALWRPSDRFELSLSALYQDIGTDGSPEIYPSLSGMQHSYLTDFAGSYERKTQAYSARTTIGIGNATATLLTGYNINRVHSTIDFSVIPFWASVDPVPIYGDQLHVKKFTQEARISLPISSRIEWLIGGYYAHEDALYRQTIRGHNPQTGAAERFLQNVDPISDLKEFSVFSNVTVRLTDRFDIQIGGRQAHIKQTYDQIFELGAARGGPLTIVSPQVQSKDNAFTYLFTPRYRITPEVMVYARLASGYRPGGPNTSLVVGAPAQYDADTTKSYEVGVKGETADRRLSFDASLYYIDWKNFQLTLVPENGGGGYNTNGGRARSMGVEANFAWRPTPEFTISGWGVWNEAELAEDFPATGTLVGSKNDPLPYSSKFSGNLTLSYEREISDGWRGFASGTAAYVGKRVTFFAPAGIGTTERQVLPAYGKLDLTFGVRRNSWSITAYVNNATDSRGRLAGGLYAFNPSAFNVIQPRTTGVSVSKEF